jgi:regulatory protein
VPRITALRPTRRPGRCAVHVDGTYAFTVDEGFLARHALPEGCDLSDAEYDAIRSDAEGERALADAYRLLGHRARSRAELAAKLRQRGHDEPTVTLVMARVDERGLLDDDAFARAFAADKKNLGGWGRDRVVRELRRLGVDDHIVADVLPADDEGEVGRALVLLRKRGPARPPLDAARRRARDQLLRRGFSSPVAGAAVRRWLDETPTSQ